MTKTRILLGSALALSFAALMAVVTRPRPHVVQPGEVVMSKGGAVRIEARPSHGAVHANGSELFAEFTVTLLDEGKAAKTDQPISLALVLDTSGSMSGAKMEDARKAAHQLVDLLTERDELALVSFGTEITVAERRAINAESRASFHAAIDALQPAGSTNISGGLERGLSALRGAGGGKRLVLVSDGQPTVGLISDYELAGLVGRVHDESITLTALGVGADIDGALMLHLAERGGGMYGYLKDAGALEEILGREVTAARSAFARNVELRFDPTRMSIAEVPGRHLEWVDGQPVLHLADLRPNMPTRVLVKLSSVRASPGDFVRLGATVTWRSLEGGAQRSEVAFNTAVVDDLEEVTRSRDEAVFSRGISAVGSQQLLAAAAAWERGDSTGASSLLDNARSLFGMSADALAGESEVDQLRQQFKKTAGTVEKREFARGLERKKLSNFGLENSGY
jgi:Ca-activated chloride channel homolog